MNEFLVSLGFELKTLVASALGSIAAAFLMPNVDRAKLAAILVVGVIAGNYFGGWVSQFLNMPTFSGGASALIAFGALPIGKRILDFFESGALPFIGGGKKDG